MVNQSENTITIVPKPGKKEIIYSKRDVATGSSGKNVQKGQKERKEAKWSNMPSISKQANKAEKPKLKRKIIESDDLETEDIDQTPAPKMYIASTLVTNTENNEEEEAILEQPAIKNDTNSSVNNEEKQPIAQETEVNQKLTITGTVKWEKARSSQRVSKKPDRWGHNIMVTKIEAMSSAEEESLPSVFEIQKPNTK